MDAEQTLLEARTQLEKREVGLFMVVFNVATASLYMASFAQSTAHLLAISLSCFHS